MEIRVPPSLMALCGSATRVRTLAVLAGAIVPMSGYRIGKSGSIPFPKLYPELRRLELAGLVSRSREGWILLDTDVRRLFQKRLPVSPPEDWFSTLERRRRSDEEFIKRLRTVPAPRFPRGWKPRDPARFQRDPEKDRILAKMGLRTSLHGGSS